MTYNNQGLLATLGSYITSTNYSASGQLLSMGFGSGMTTNYFYNSQNLRLTQLTTAPSAGSAIQDFKYQYDNVGNVTKLIDSTRVETSTFGYDELNRVVTATIPSVYTRTWGYSAIGNITQTMEEGTQFNYAYDQNRKHAVTQRGSLYYCYDGNGNMTGHAATNSTCSSGGDSLTFDKENRLTQVQSGGGVTTTTYTYDGDGARVKMVTVANGMTNTIYYVGNYFEIDSSGIITKYYYFGAQRVAMNHDGTVTYLHSDHLGGSNVTTDASGGTVKRQVYYPFGGIRTSDTLATDYGFTGQKLDASDGLMYYGARYYDAALGRFISADTIVPGLYNPQALNRYSYVYNNPLKYSDPTGHCGDHETEQEEMDFGECEGGGGGGGSICWDCLWDWLFGGGSHNTSQQPPASNPPKLPTEKQPPPDDNLKFLKDLWNSFTNPFGNDSNETPTDASAPTGHKGSPIEVPPHTNDQTDINGHSYSGHAIDEMQSDGIPPSAVEKAIKPGEGYPGSNEGTTDYYDPDNNITVVVSDDGVIVTVTYGKLKGR